MSNDTLNVELLKGKDVFSVTERMKAFNIKYRIARENGLLTADHVPDRYTLIIDEDDKIISAYLG